MHHHFPVHVPDLADVRGLEIERLALEVAVAGGHPLLLHGPPGCGKSMLARRIGGLLPDLEAGVEAELAEILEVAYRRRRTPTSGSRPHVRMPHHTVSVAGLLGGGNPARPGEVNLAHGGALYLDELPEFPRACVEGVQHVLEEGCSQVARAGQLHSWPARFLLVGGMTDCPCGWRGHHERVCMDSPAAIARYQDRVASLEAHWDLAVRVGAAGEFEPHGETTAVVRARIEAARQRRADRGERELPVAPGVELGAGPEAARLQRVATTLAELGHTSDAEFITADGVELARRLFELPARVGA